MKKSASAEARRKVAEGDKPEVKSLPQTWDEGTVWIKNTNAKGEVSYTEHRCWNMKGFVARMCVAALEAGGECEQINEDDYRKAVGLRIKRKKTARKSFAVISRAKVSASGAGWNSTSFAIRLSVAKLLSSLGLSGT